MKSLLLLLLWPGLALGQLEVEKTVSGDVGDLLVVHATTPADHVKWYAPDTSLKYLPPELLKDSKVAVVYAKKPGKYQLYAWAAVNNEPFFAICEITIGSPTPEPGPKPTPVTAKAWFIIVYDPLKLTTAQSRTIADKPYWDQLEKAGHYVDTADKNSEKAKNNNYNQYVSGKNKPYPAVVVCKDGGEWIKTVPLPANREQFNDLVKEVTGQ